MPHVFEEFTREHTSTESKVAGVGLGLHIVKSLVELMDGTISVESKVGEGTKFTVVLSFETATEEQIRKRTDGCENIPIVAMTANAFEEDRKKAFAVDMNGHIAKPIDTTVLFTEMERIFA